jgi:hypothetical protein
MLRSRLLPFVWVMGMPVIMYGQCEPNAYSPLSITIQVPWGQVIPTYSAGDGCAKPDDKASDKGGPKVVHGQLELIFWGRDWQTAAQSEPGRHQGCRSIHSPRTISLPIDSIWLRQRAT